MTLHDSEPRTVWTSSDLKNARKHGSLTARTTAMLPLDVDRILIGTGAYGLIIASPGGWIPSLYRMALTPSHR
jgi:hypothetical protein